MITKLKLSKIIANPNQPRKHFNEESLNELANSILNDGLQEPILVRPLGDKYEIVQGERRYRASQIAGLETIEVKIKDLNDEESFHLSVIENIQREDMTAIEEAHAFYKYVEMGYTHEAIAKKISKNRDYVTSRLRLLKLVPFLHDWIAEGYISDGHAKQILKMESLLNRFLSEKPTSKYKETLDGPTLEKSHFEEFQYKFHGSFWEKHHHKEKLTVNDVKDWVEGWRYGFIESTVLQYQGMGNCIVSVNRGFPMTAEMECHIHNLHISKIIEDDIDFAVAYDMERYKGDFDKELRPCMIEKYWDDIRSELFNSDVNVGEKWRLNNFKDTLNQSEQYRDALGEKLSEVITGDIKFYYQRLEEMSKNLELPMDELIADMMKTVGDKS